MNMRKAFSIIIVLLMLFAISGCAPGPNDVANTPDSEGDVAGFWSGLWHGFIVLFTFVISLFSDSVHPYEIHNNGNWYNLGFVLGAMLFFGGSGGASCKSKS